MYEISREGSGEAPNPRETLERDFGHQIVDAVDRLRDIAPYHKMESLMHTLKRMLAGEGVEVSEEQWESLTRFLEENKQALGLDSENG